MTAKTTNGRAPATVEITARSAEPTTSDFAKEWKRINDVVQDISKLTTYVIAVLLVMVATLIVTVGGIVWNAFQNQAAAEQNLTSQMQTLEKCIASKSSNC